LAQIILNELSRVSEVKFDKVTVKAIILQLKRERERERERGAGNGKRKRVVKEKN